MGGILNHTCDRAEISSCNIYINTIFILLLNQYKCIFKGSVST